MTICVFFGASSTGALALGLVMVLGVDGMGWDGMGEVRGVVWAVDGSFQCVGEPKG